MAVGDRRRGVPDALGRAAARSPALFERALFVGDPGQLDPFSIVDAERWAGPVVGPVQSAVAVLLRHNPDLPVHRLPVSWRLPASAAPVVSEAFYPFTGVPQPAPDHGDRRADVRASARHGSASTGRSTRPPRTGWALLELPARHTLRTDAEAVAGRAPSWPSRLLERGAVALSERSRQPPPVTADRIAIGTAHRDQAAAVRAALAELGVTGRHGGHREPAPGPRVRRDGRAAPAVRPPRRHRVPPGDGPAVRAGLPAPARVHRGRAGRASPSCWTPTRRPSRSSSGVPVKFPDGWEANQAVLAHLAEHRVTPPAEGPAVRPDAITVDVLVCGVGEQAGVPRPSRAVTGHPGRMPRPSARRGSTSRVSPCCAGRARYGQGVPR